VATLDGLHLPRTSSAYHHFPQIQLHRRLRRKLTLEYHHTAARTPPSPAASLSRTRIHTHTLPKNCVLRHPPPINIHPSTHILTGPALRQTPPSTSIWTERPHRGGRSAPVHTTASPAHRCLQPLYLKYTVSSSDNIAGRYTQHCRAPASCRTTCCSHHSTHASNTRLARPTSPLSSSTAYLPHHLWFYSELTRNVLTSTV